MQRRLILVIFLILLLTLEDIFIQFSMPRETFPTKSLFATEIGPNVKPIRVNLGCLESSPNSLGEISKNKGKGVM